jgi:hypothetical protein
VRKRYGASFFVVVLLVVFSGTALAASACLPGELIVGPATLSGGTTLTSTFSCTEGAFTFSNFEVVGDVVPVPISSFALSTGPSTSASGLVLGLGYTDLDSNGDDFVLTFQISPGVGHIDLSAGPAVSVTELLCSVPTSLGGSCTGTVLNQTILSASNGGSSSSNVTLAGTDYVFKDIAGGSNVIQAFASSPEPATFSLMGLGLVALGFVGRKRVRKD